MEIMRRRDQKSGEHGNLGKFAALSTLGLVSRTRDQVSGLEFQVRIRIVITDNLGREWQLIDMRFSSTHTEKKLMKRHLVLSR
jgi:hypothetical protein